MQEPWETLIDGQGNFGSIDGDSAAAMRYTESRMEKISSEMLRDIEKKTVKWQLNFDDTIKEPTVLPTVIPTLLMNGADGIAVGMATKIPPHNLNELISGLIALLEKPETTIEELITGHIKGPDFPTGGTIIGTDGIKDAYNTGRGKLLIRGKAEIEETSTGRERILINEIPYQVNKANLIEKIAHLVRDKKLEGISDLRDESDKDGIRIVVECKRDAIANVVLNNLYSQTQLQETYGVILLALSGGVPGVMNLKTILNHFLKFRREIIIKRTRFERNEAEARAHILEGLKIALDNIDKAIELIKKSKDPTAANQQLQTNFKLSEKQSKAILEMRLQKLTSLETEKIIEEYNDLLLLIKDLNDILKNEKRQSQIIKEEFEEILEKYGDERKTNIIEGSGTLSIEDMIAEEDMVITITHNGYIKRLASSGWKTQRRGGRGMKGAQTKEEDFVEHLFVASTHDHMLFFTDRGKCYWLKVHEIPIGSRASQGRAVVNLIGCESGEKVKAFVSVKEFDSNHYIMMSTKNGMIKKSSLKLYSKPRKGGIYAIEVRENDELIEAKITNGNNNILLGTNSGKSILFKETDIRSTGRKTMGVRGIRLGSDKDRLVGMIVVEEEGTVLVASSKGLGKRTDIGQYRIQKRGGKGVITLKTTNKVGKMVAILDVVDTDDLMIITNKGVMIRQSVEHIRTIGRNTQGVKLLRLDDGSKISSITKVMEKEEEEENEAEENPK